MSAGPGRRPRPGAGPCQSSPIDGRRAGFMVADGQGQVRRSGIRRAVVAAGLVVGVAGGIAGWNAVAELDDAHTRAARARRDFADLEGTVRARLDEADDAETAARATVGITAA